MLLPFASHAQQRTFGHNLAHTDLVFDGDYNCTVGVQVTACGRTSWVAGTSPFLIRFYDMKNLYFRKRLKKGEKWTHTAQLAYFDVDKPMRANHTFNYKMQAIWAYYIFSKQIDKDLRVHLNIIPNYYFNDKRPFSLRRPTMRRQKYQLNVSSLFEFDIHRNFSFNNEIGALHLTDKYPRFHLGSTVAYKTKRWLFQIGFSLTATFSGLFVNPQEPSRHDYQQELLADDAGYEQDMDEDLIKDDFSLHPEIAIQYFF